LVAFEHVDRDHFGVLTRQCLHDVDDDASLHIDADLGRRPNARD
jgi:hypothetical protein